ncbi:hypothetical protein SK128_018887 [Halocaridina rubra]|uniref:Uncharacterized protein n=1 Tax=Halocaridina rubra TaxID=373956 RepID=A0AAN9AEG3_HALRR
MEARPVEMTPDDWDYLPPLYKPENPLETMSTSTDNVNMETEGGGAAAAGGESIHMTNTVEIPLKRKMAVGVIYDDDDDDSTIGYISADDDDDGDDMTQKPSLSHLNTQIMFDSDMKDGNTVAPIANEKDVSTKKRLYNSETNDNGTIKTNIKRNKIKVEPTPSPKDVRGESCEGRKRKNPTPRRAPVNITGENKRKKVSATETESINGTSSKDSTCRTKSRPQFFDIPHNGNMYMISGPKQWHALSLNWRPLNKKSHIGGLHEKMIETVNNIHSKLSLSLGDIRNCGLNLFLTKIYALDDGIAWFEDLKNLLSGNEIRQYRNYEAVKITKIYQQKIMSEREFHKKIYKLVS